MNHRDHRQGFTLLEMLIVIAIIGILVSIIGALILNVRRNAQIAATNANIELVTSAMNTYKAEYMSFPPVYTDQGIMPDASMSSGKALSTVVGASLTTTARNELLVLWLTTTFAGFGKGAASGPFLLENQIGFIDDSDFNGFKEFTDAWKQPLVFLMPGIDHTGEVDENGLKRPAMDNTMLKLSGALGDWDLENPKFDLYSLGYNQTDDTGLALSGGAGSYSGLTYDKNADGGAWFHKAPGKYSKTNIDNDDIGNWKAVSKKHN